MDVSLFVPSWVRKSKAELRDKEETLDADSEVRKLALAMGTQSRSTPKRPDTVTFLAAIDALALAASACGVSAHMSLDVV